MMIKGQPRGWERAALDALRAGETLAGAARIARIHRTTIALHAKRDARFAAELAAARATPRKKGPSAVPPPRKTVHKLELFLTRLAETSNVSAAAEEADLATGTVYALRRSDPEFARRWYVALAEGYDNLEMDLLARLREGRMEDTDAEGNKRKFDFATALRCLTAHRENVAREKGRRTLAEEAATIEAINAKIDALRLRARQGDAQVRKAKKAVASRTKRNG